MMKGKLWIKWYNIRPHVLYAAAHFLWIVCAIPMLTGAFLTGWALADLSWWRMLFGVVIWGVGMRLLAPVDDGVRRYRHEYKHRHWQGDIPEWRP